MTFFSAAMQSPSARRFALDFPLTTPPVLCSLMKSSMQSRSYLKARISRACALKTAQKPTSPSTMSSTDFSRERTSPPTSPAPMPTCSRRMSPQSSVDAEKPSWSPRFRSQNSPKRCRRLGISSRSSTPTLLSADSPNAPSLKPNPKSGAILTTSTRPSISATSSSDTTSRTTPCLKS